MLTTGTTCMLIQIEGCYEEETAEYFSVEWLYLRTALQCSVQIIIIQNEVRKSEL